MKEQHDEQQREGHPTSPWIALIHIFRFQDNQMIEEWESSQEVPQDSPNQYGVF